MTRDETIQKLNQLLVLIDNPSTPVQNDYFDSLERPIKPEYKTVDPTYLDGTHKVLKEPNPTRESVKKVYDFINNYIILVVFIGLFSFVWSIFFSKRGEYLFLFSVACFVLVLIQIVCGIIIKILPKEITSSKHYDNIRKYQEAVYYNEHEYPELQKQYYVDLEKYERIINSDEYKEYQLKQYTTRKEHDNRIKEASEELGLEFDSDSALKNTVSRLLEIFEKNEELSSIKTALRILEDEKVLASGNINHVQPRQSNHFSVKSKQPIDTRSEHMPRKHFSLGIPLIHWVTVMVTHSYHSPPLLGVRGSGSQ